MRDCSAWHAITMTCAPPIPSPRWVSTEVAAAFLGLTPLALRRTLERSAERMPDGGVEANVDGVRARKFGPLWRVQFTGSWLSPSAEPTR